MITGLLATPICSCVFVWRARMIAILFLVNCVHVVLPATPSIIRRLLVTCFSKPRYQFVVTVLHGLLLCQGTRTLTGAAPAGRGRAEYRWPESVPDACIVG